MIDSLTRLLSGAGVVLCSFSLLWAAGPPPSLTQQLNTEGPAALAKAARLDGDPQRGAYIYFRYDLLCTRCHAAGEAEPKPGPDLSKGGKEITDEYVVESILFPSKVIKKGFETVAIATEDGKTYSGLLVEDRADAVVLRDPAIEGPPTVIAKKDIAEQATKNLSLMPEGQIAALGSRQEFLDLVRYLMEIAEKGPTVAKKLRPSAALFTPPPLPDYEKSIDHAGLLGALNAKSLKRGEALYKRVCNNCHGTREQEGSMPTSLKFWADKFKNGSEPHRLYQTLTYGYAMMTPQHWMVPEQKYDVIHYIRETFVKPYNPSEYKPITPEYLASLPPGTNRGPKPNNTENWVNMNYGPSMMATMEVSDQGNFAYKGIAARLDNGAGGISRGHQWMLFDHDTLRMVAAWEGESFINWRGINFNGEHQIHPRITGKVIAANKIGPGWADPATGKFDDPRLRSRDDKPYGPLPRPWARYLGTYHYGHQTILSYTVGDAKILEMPSIDVTKANESVFVRTLNIGKSSRDLCLRVAPENVTAVTSAKTLPLTTQDGQTLLKIPAASTPVALNIYLSAASREAVAAYAATAAPPADLATLTHGGPRRWPEILKTKAVLATGAQAYVTDGLTQPETNPWNCLMRFTGLDFFSDGNRGAICSWDGDVWLVTGLNAPENGLTWQRIASGLFQPLGLKIVKDKVHVCCRDQIVILHDLNNDGETDYYECFNNDHQVTEHFHEFAMGLQTDDQGNFYYAKGARHALKAIVPQHGTLLRVSPDGSKTDILAVGFRAPNGMCLNPDGTFFLTDQEGFWLPKNRINYVKPGGYYGNFWGYHDVTDESDAAMEQPVCWITNDFDRSPSEMLWVTTDKWGPLQGQVLNFSYGYGKVYVVPYEKHGDIVQGGMCELPLPKFPTGVMRGRFHPTNGQLYCCGMYAWAGNQTVPGGFYRVRYTGQPVYLPVGLHVHKDRIDVTFSGELDPKSVADVKNFAVKTWGLKRSAQYGSKHYDEKPSEITGVKLSPDRKTITLEIPGIVPVWSMEIKYALTGGNGASFQGKIHNSIQRCEE